MSEADRCLIVVVMYKMAAEDSMTVRGIAEAMRDDSRLRDAYEVLLWDNTPGGDSFAPERRDVLGLTISYQRAVANDGVAGGYNAAMSICIQNGVQWMMLLDQDTVVTGAYLEGMLHHHDAVAGVADVAAIVPLLLDGKFQLSPKQVLRFRDKPIAPAQPGILAGEVFAANSGVVLRVSALQAIGGYSRDFWLDHSDMYVFHRLYREGWRVFFASDVSLQHSMTMLDYDGSMSPGRYENFLAAEQAFFDLYKSSTENTVQVLRLLMRVIRQRRRYRNNAFSELTRQFLLRRLQTSKTVRLEMWRRRAEERRASVDQINDRAAL